MKRVWQRPGMVVAGLLVSAVYAMPQYTVSARPGAVNYIEGDAYLNNKPLSEKGLRSTYLDAGDTLSTDAGKAEVLLTPGVFLRIGNNTLVRMISPSLTDTQFEVKRGEAILEADGLLKENHVTVLDHGATVSIEKNGLYRFTADDPPTTAVLDGKAEVLNGTQRVDLGKGHETILAENLKPKKFNTKQPDDLYAWSNVRSEYDAAASYRSASTASLNSYGGGWGDYGFLGGLGPGWYWNSAFSGFGWLPASGAFYSPFGYGFYAPTVVGYAPIVTTPVYRGGGWSRTGNGTHANWHWRGNGSATRAAVPVNPDSPAAVGTVSPSPWANRAVRMSAAQGFAESGFRTASGGTVPAFSGQGSWSGNRGASRGAWSGRGSSAGAGRGAWSGGAGHGGWSGGAAHAGGFSGDSHGGGPVSAHR